MYVDEESDIISTQQDGCYMKLRDDDALCSDEEAESHLQDLESMASSGNKNSIKELLRTVQSVELTLNSAYRAMTAVLCFPVGFYSSKKGGMYERINTKRDIQSNADTDNVIADGFEAPLADLVKCCNLIEKMFYLHSEGIAFFSKAVMHEKDSSLVRPSPDEDKIFFRRVNALLSIHMIPSLMSLFEHGLRCGDWRVWDVVLAYYEYQGGDNFNTKPSELLWRSFAFDPTETEVDSDPESQSFGVKVVKSFIRAIYTVERTCKSSKEMRFRALMYRGLKEQQVHLWLQLLSLSDFVVHKFYSKNSFITSASLTNALQALQPFSTRLLHVSGRISDN